MFLTNDKPSNEMEILRLLIKSRGYYEKYWSLVKPFIKSKDFILLYDAIDGYYQFAANHTYISQDDLLLYLETNYSHLLNKAAFSIYLDSIYGIDLSSDTIKQYVHRLIEESTYKDIDYLIQDALLTNKYNLIESIETKIQNYKNIVNKADGSDPFIQFNLEEYAKKEEEGFGFKWRLNCLNDEFGKLKPQTLGHIFARPESGKTTMLASEISFFAEQLSEGDTILWFNNEQAGNEVNFRLYQSALNAPARVILSNVEKANLAYQKHIGNKIRIYDNAYITYDDLRRYADEYKPKCIVIDQGDKVTFKGAKDLNEVMRLKELYRHFRELAKEYDTAIITVGQAAGEAEGKKWLSMDHMDFSKTGKPGEMDWILGIGKTKGDGEESIRYLNIAKNKLTGKHGKYAVLIDTDKARYTDMA